MTMNGLQGLRGALLTPVLALLAWGGTAHAQSLDEIVDAARGFSDDVAERMRAVYALPDARAKTVAAQSSLPEFPATEVDTAETVDRIAAALYAVAGTARRVHDEVDQEDPTSADLLHAILERIEQLAWMVDAENRVAGASAPGSVTP